MADYFILNSYVASEIIRPHGPDTYIKTGAVCVTIEFEC
jgi:hypothetical protein